MKYRIIMLSTIFFLIIAAVFAGAIVLFRIFPADESVYYAKPELPSWRLQSIDTMKYSRDLSREKLYDPSFDDVIDAQVKNIAGTGATHVAIDTPYDDEFLPMLKRWVKAARKYDLKVWFRGNWAGWERWFDYPQITREEHIRKTEAFIRNNPDIFEDGDIFSSCPECENGGSGYPSLTADTEGYRAFIISEYQAAKKSFADIDKRVGANYFSMNADVARLVMDKKTTEALDGIVTIDHYVGPPEKLAADAEKLSASSGGKVVLGEFGAPIPDLNGTMPEAEQADWIRHSLSDLVKVNSLYGVNYWSNVGSSTQIWDEQGHERMAVRTLREFYKPGTVYGTVHDELDNLVANAEISSSGAAAFSGIDGYFALPYVRSNGSTLRISAQGFEDQSVEIPADGSRLKIVMVKKDKDPVFKLLEFLKKLAKT